MRFIFFILFSLSAGAQTTLVLPARVSYYTPPQMRTVIYEPFDGVSLSSDWSVRNPGSQTITVSGGEATITGSGTSKDFRYMLRDTAYGYSMIRNYIMSLDFKINAIDANSTGIFIGVWCPYVSDFRFTTFATLDFRAADTLAVCASNDTTWFSQPIPRTTTLAPTFNTSDTYRLKLIMDEGTATSRIINVTTGDSTSIDLDYEFAISGIWPLRPMYFYYTFGVMGSTSIDALEFSVKTYEVLQPKYCFVGNSITTGYTAGSADSAFAYKCRPYTNDTVQIMAGAGHTMLTLRECLDEIIAVDPQYVFLNIGTNAGGSFATDYTYIVSTLEAAGIDVIPTLTVNGGNPATGGTFNNSIATTYSDEIDLWTTGWNTMTVGNGLMADAIHPSNTGMTLLRNIIVAARPDLFPVTP